MPDRAELGEVIIDWQRPPVERRWYHLFVPGLANPPLPKFPDFIQMMDVPRRISRANVQAIQVLRYTFTGYDVDWIEVRRVDGVPQVERRHVEIGTPGARYERG